LYKTYGIHASLYAFKISKCEFRQKFRDETLISDLIIKDMPLMSVFLQGFSHYLTQSFERTIQIITKTELGF